MKITQQEKDFAPITIVIETAEEAEVLWAAIRDYATMHPHIGAILIDLSDWFSTQARL